MTSLAKLFLGARLHLLLSQTGCSLFFLASARQRAGRLLLEAPFGKAPDEDPSALIALLKPALAGGAYSGLPLIVTVSDDWVRLFLVTPPRNAAGPQDIRAAAAMRFHTLYGDDLALWRIVCDEGVGRPLLACAMSAALCSAVETLARDLGLRLCSFRPLFVLAWNDVLRRLRGAWLGVVENDWITIGCVEKREKVQLAAVHRLLLPNEEVDFHWLREQVKGVALRYGLGDPAELKLFGRPFPSLKSSGHGLPISWLEPASRGFIPVFPNDGWRAR